MFFIREELFTILSRSIRICIPIFILSCEVIIFFIGSRGKVTELPDYEEMDRKRRSAAGVNQEAGIIADDRNVTERVRSIFRVREFQIRSVFLGGFLPTHTVRKDETLYGISQAYFVPVTVLAAVNRIEDPRQIQEHSRLLIPPVDRQWPSLFQYRVQPGETMASIARKHHLESWQLKRLNPGLNEGMFPDRIVLARVVVKRELHQLQTKPVSKRFYLRRPVLGVLSSRYGRRWGRMHYGIDLAASLGTPVHAAASGRVVFAGWRGAYGLLIKIDHGSFFTYYGHLSRIGVKPGRRVAAEEIIGLVGSTGRSYGSHLHFEVERRGRKVNPKQYLGEI